MLCQIQGQVPGTWRQGKTVVRGSAGSATSRASRDQEMTQKGARGPGLGVEVLAPPSSSNASWAASFLSGLVFSTLERKYESPQAVSQNAGLYEGQAT